MADDKAQSPLEALNARGLTAKREYVRGLEQRRDPEALSLLVECLCDESWFLRDLAEQAFFRMGEEHAAPLVPLLTGGLWYTRLSAVRLLGRLGFRPAVPALIDLCDDKNETVAQAAREALLAVARQRGTARIAHALQRTTPERRKLRLAQIAESDRGLAKQLERLMADVDLMAADKPDSLVDPEEAPRAGAPAVGAPKAGVGLRAGVAVKPPATPKSTVAPKSATAPMPAVAPKPASAPTPAPVARAADAPKPAPSTAAAPASGSSASAGIAQSGATGSSAPVEKTAAGESKPAESRSPAEHSSLFGGPVSRAQRPSDAAASAARPGATLPASDAAPESPAAPPASASSPAPAVVPPKPEASKPPAPPKPAAAKPATPKALASPKASAPPKAPPKPPAPPKPAADVPKSEPSGTAAPAAAPEPPKAPAPAAREPAPAPPVAKAGEPPDGG